jgi:hypothetical protein
MSNLSLHSARRSFRHTIAAGMTALYLAMIFSPLVPFAMQSTGTDPVVVRECSGDCNLCGCSPESRAANTCCCSKKRQQQAHLHDDGEDGTADCCKKDSVAKKAVIACGCPCGSGKQATLSSSGTSETLPFHFTEQFGTPHTETTFTTPAQRLTSRHNDPPDPPPKLV